MGITIGNYTSDRSKAILKHMPVRVLHGPTVKCLCCLRTFMGFYVKGRSKREFALRRCVDHRQTKSCSDKWPGYLDRLLQEEALVQRVVIAPT